MRANASAARPTHVRRGASSSTGEAWSSKTANRPWQGTRLLPGEWARSVSHASMNAGSGETRRLRSKPRFLGWMNIEKNMVWSDFGLWMADCGLEKPENLPKEIEI